MKKAGEIKKIVKEGYAKMAEPSCSCCSAESSAEEISKSVGYSDEEIKAVPEANLGLGCGNPLAMSKIKKGDVVLDLGSGAGLDTFLAAKLVGAKGKVIGVDMTKEMVKKSEANAKKYDFKNTEFRLGDIEKLPMDSGSVDVIISNCVINLAPNKEKVFAEAYRVLKPGGRMYVSDIVLLEELSDSDKDNEYLITGCVGGADLKDDYLKKIKQAGFKVNILDEDKAISKRQYQGIPLESLKIEAVKEK